MKSFRGGSFARRVVASAIGLSAVLGVGVVGAPAASAATCTAVAGVAATDGAGGCTRHVIPFPNVSTTWPRATAIPANVFPARQLGASENPPALGSETRTVYFVLPSGTIAVYAPKGTTIPDPSTPIVDAGDPATAITSRWTNLGGSTAALGGPTSSVYATGSGWGQAFQNGTIYFSAISGAHEVRGDVKTRYTSVGSTSSSLGFPVTDQKPAASGRGVYNFFSSGGAIYSGHATGAFVLSGPVFSRWAAFGKDTGILGFPTSDADALRTQVVSEGRYTTFENGAIYWTPTTGRKEIHGSIYRTWVSLGAETSALGFPISDVASIPGGTRSTFEHGTITYSYATNTTTVVVS